MISRPTSCRRERLAIAHCNVVDVPTELEGEWRVEEDFLAAVKSKGRVRPHPNFEDGLRYMRVVQAVSDSRARTNGWQSRVEATGILRGHRVWNEISPYSRAQISSVIS